MASWARTRSSKVSCGCCGERAEAVGEDESTTMIVAKPRAILLTGNPFGGARSEGTRKSLLPNAAFGATNCPALTAIPHASVLGNLGGGECRRPRHEWHQDGDCGGRSNSSACGCTGGC